VDTNLQIVPTPLFYIGKSGLSRFVQEDAPNVAAAVTSATVHSAQISAVADSAGNAASVISALYVAPAPDNIGDQSINSASIIGATITNTFFQRAGQDAANTAVSIISAVKFSAHSENVLDAANSSCSIVSSTVMNSTQYPLIDGTAQNQTFAHGLGHVPVIFSCVLLCTSNDSASGIVAGNEVAVESFLDDNAPATVFGFGADSTSITVRYSGVMGPNVFVQWPGGTTVTSFSNFSLKIYWQ
jgi:hypothetical protein